ncbi:uncharacterized protein LOC112564653 isoform X3 [Pomacea canaliculata]|uniref:uncharacterized protein LOC112564653 isoform X3 n=1 Tax=Pomacea canaliculata TaxID=400727 RepID=UPI000D72F677|nr:uncharacterized protein LOC112564653 isoform X3 [Pomacea canaliculata]
MANFSAGSMMNQYYQSAGTLSNMYDTSHGTWQQGVGTPTTNTQSQQNQSSQSQLDLYTAGSGGNAGSSASGYGYTTQTSYGQQDYVSGAFDSNISMGMGSTTLNTNHSNNPINFGNTVGGSGNFSNVGNNTGQAGGNFNNNTSGGFAGSNSASGHYGSFGNNSNMGHFFQGDMCGNYGTALGNSMLGLVGQNLYQGSVNWDGDGGYYAAPMDNFQAFEKKEPGFRGKKWVGKDRQDFYGERFSHQNYLGYTWGGTEDGDGKRGKNRKTAGLQSGVRFNVNNEKVVDVEIPLQTFSRWGHLRKYFHKRDTDVARHIMEIHDMFCEECYDRDEKKKQQKEEKKQVQEKGENSEETAEEKTEETTEEEVEIRRIMGFSSFNTTKGAMVEGSKIEGHDAELQLNELNTGRANTAVHVQEMADALLSGATQLEKESEKPFIGPMQPVNFSDISKTDCAEAVASSGDSEMHHETQVESQTVQPGKESEETKGLTEEEKAVMKKLGWSVFNNKKGEAKKNNDDVDDGDDNDDDANNDDDDDDDESKKETTATEDLSGQWKMLPGENKES